MKRKAYKDHFTSRKQTHHSTYRHGISADLTNTKRKKKEYAMPTISTRDPRCGSMMTD